MAIGELIEVMQGLSYIRLLLTGAATTGGALVLGIAGANYTQAGMTSFYQNVANEPVRMAFADSRPDPVATVTPVDFAYVGSSGDAAQGRVADSAFMEPEQARAERPIRVRSTDSESDYATADRQIAREPLPIDPPLPPDPVDSQPPAPSAPTEPLP